MDRERRGNIIPFTPVKDQRDAQKLQDIIAVRTEARQRLQRARVQLNCTSEDAYVTRNNLHATVAFLSTFTGKIDKATPGSTVDLRRTIIDYGDDFEDDPANVESGSSSGSDADAEAAEYERHIDTVRPILRKLEGSGVRVKTGIKYKLPPEEFDLDC